MSETGQGPEAVSPSVDCGSEQQGEARVLQASSETKSPTLVPTLDSERLARIAVLFSALSIGAFIMPLPSLTPVKEAYFGSSQQAALVQSIVDSIGALVNLLLSLPFGRLLERHGRRTFFLSASVANACAIGTLLLFPNTPIVFMLAIRVAGLIQSSYLQCYVTDLTNDPLVRARYLGWLEGSICVAYFFAVPAALYPSDRDPYPIYLSAFIVILIALVVAWKSVVETRTATAIEEAVKAQSVAQCESPFAGVSLLFTTPVWRMATLIAVLVTTLDAGAAEVNLFYLNDVLNMSPSDLGLMMLEMGALTVIVFGWLLPKLLKAFSLTYVLCLSTAVNIMLLTLMMLLWASWPVYAIGIPLSSFTLIVTPLSQQLVAQHDEDTLDRRIAALGALVAAGQIVGSLSFGVLYSVSPSSFRGLPYLVGVVASCAATWLAVKLHRHVLATSTVQVTPAV